MSQRYKSIYFSDCPGVSAKERNLTLAFGDKDSAVYAEIQALSSHEIRGLLGHGSYELLRQNAERERLGLNTYCLRLLRSKTSHPSYGGAQQWLPGVNGQPRPLVDPIQATYRGGQTEPLHGWYPYLEGYSPQFVEQVVQEFTPQATRVLDPFAGTGTTPLTVIRHGCEAFYCELNPLLQYLIDTKTLALQFESKERKAITDALDQYATAFETLLAEARPDEELRLAHEQTFGRSQFFDDHVYERILRARTVIDQVACTKPHHARFLTIAILASLLLVSRLIRRGDVRFKTPTEYAKIKVDFVKTVQERLRLISQDLSRLMPGEHTPLLVCENARHLDMISPLDINAVITSPPYLNGTNYFRNTKIELWFLRCLRTSNDLSDFRRKAITAGINDVTVAKTTVEAPPACKGVIKRLEASAYDVRIPRMAAGYFFEMQSVFSALRKHLTNRATVVMDIGDSAYGNVHVATDAILTEILESLGFKLCREVILRRRLSRGGFALRQMLLVFDWYKTTSPTCREASGTPVWASTWAEFKTDLPHQRGEFNKRNWGHALHSLCSYQGKMKPSLASHLVHAFLPKGGSMLDPFGGVGTIPFEAALSGIKTFSFDISPTALHISRAKLGLPEAEACSKLLTTLEGFIQDNQVNVAEIKSAAEIHFNGVLSEYFAPRTFKEVLLARRFFLQHPPHTASESLVLASLLHILHGNRPYALSRRSHPITPFAPTGPSNYRALLPRLREKIQRGLAVGRSDRFVEGRVFFQDATSWWPREVEQLDAIITSPPFFDSTRFYLANWMRLWFCGWEASDFKIQPLAFVDERQKNSFDVYQPVFRQARERLKPGGVFVLHLGKSKKCDMAKHLSSLASQWFRTVDIFSENVDHCESHGIRDKGSVREHRYLVLQ